MKEFGMNDNGWESFREKLLETHQWPCLYPFKFIVPMESKEQMAGIFGNIPVVYRPSSSGKYTSVSAEFMVANCEEVVAIYRKASLIKGVIAL